MHSQLPEPGQIVIVRQRPFTVVDVKASQLPVPSHLNDQQSKQHLVRLSSVEDEGLGEGAGRCLGAGIGRYLFRKGAASEFAGF